MKSIEKITSELQDKTSAELVEIYNEAAVANIKKFSDRATALKRTAQVLFDNQATSKSEAAPKATPEAAPKAKKEKKAKAEKPGFQAYDLPASSVIKPHREGTKRGKLIEILLKGARYEDIEERVGFKKPRGFRSSIAKLHKNLGYGVRTDDKGVIYLLAE